MTKLTVLEFNSQVYTPELLKLRSGYLLKDILDRSSDKHNGVLTPNRSLWMYSTHDDVVYGILYALGVSRVSIY